MAHYSPGAAREFSVFSNLLFDIRTEALQNELTYRALELFGIHVECVGTRVIVRLCSRHSPAFLVGNLVAGTALHRTPRGGDYVP